MAIIGDKITLDNILVGNIARNQMESKMELTTKGALYVGTGKTNSVTPDGGGTAVLIPITSHIAPNGASDNGKVLVADASKDVGWKVEKITADNLEGGRVAQATNADQATKADTVSYNGDYKSFIDAFVSACLLKIYPVGSIYMTVDKDRDPAAFLGGTWERWGQGCVPVGVSADANDSDFGKVEQQGGERKHQLITSEMPNHKHPYQINDRGYGGTIGFSTNQGSLENVAASGSNLSVIQPQLGVSENETALGQLHIGYTGGNQPHNNLQPYITCYMWKRTA